MTATEFRSRLAAAATAAEVNHLIFTGMDLRTPCEEASALLDAAVAKMERLADAAPPGVMGAGGVEELTETFPNKITT